MPPRGPTGASRAPRAEVSAVSWNVHRCVGLDGRQDAARVAGLLRQLDSDLIGLQELDVRFSPGNEVDQLALLAEATGSQALSLPTLRSPRGSYGNALLTRHPVLAVRELDLSLPGREPRAALAARLDVRGRPLRVVVTHLGLSRGERAFQARRLVELLREEAAPTLLLGDLNTWAPGEPALRLLAACLGRAPAPATFPSRFPLLALDRVWAARPLRVRSEVVRSPTARVASDHLPIRAAVRLDG